MMLMNAISKPFVALGTGLRHKPFHRARLWLTGYYTLGALVILVLFSVVVYGLFAGRLADRVEDPDETLQRIAIQKQVAEKDTEHLRDILFMADGGLLVFMALLSYLLAGMALAPVEAAYEKQKKFTADVAHELRTPLTVMKAAIESEGNAKQLSHEVGTDILAEVNHMSAMVDTLLFLMRSETSHHEHMERLNLTVTVHTQVAAMHAYARAREVQLEENLAQECFVEGNAFYLKQLVGNLLKNSIDYNKPGGTVRICLKKEKSSTVLTVRDTGIGISQKDLPHIFERFFKVDQARSAGSSGTGLGLALVQEIVAMHQGSVQVESDLGQGTLVTVRLRGV